MLHIDRFQLMRYKALKQQTGAYSDAMLPVDFVTDPIDDESSVLRFQCRREELLVGVGFDVFVCWRCGIRWFQECLKAALMLLASVRSETCHTFGTLTLTSFQVERHLFV